MIGICWCYTAGHKTMLLVKSLLRLTEHKLAMFKVLTLILAT